MLITSLDNKKIKDLVKLRNKKYRDLYGKFVVDSVNFIKEADKLGLLLEVYILDGNDLDVSCCKYFVTDKVMNKIKSVNTCLYVGIVNKPVFDGNLGDRILLLDGVCDPGNMGTIIRSALGFNVSSVVLSNTCCDLYNDKCLRACEGSILKVNVLRDDLVPSQISKTIAVPFPNAWIDENNTQVRFTPQLGYMFPGNAPGKKPFVNTEFGTKRQYSEIDPELEQVKLKVVFEADITLLNGRFIGSIKEDNNLTA